MKGTIKRFYFRKGFGFIQDATGTEYFFHYSDFTGEKRQITPELEVSFDAQDGDKGLSAVNVLPLGGTVSDLQPRRPAARPAEHARGQSAPAAASGPRPAGPRPAARESRAAARKTSATRPPALAFTAGLAIGVIVGAGGYAWMANLM